MKKISFLILLGIAIGFYFSYSSKALPELILPIEEPNDSIILSYEVNPLEQDLKFFWKDDSGKNYRSLQNLKNELAAKGKKLVFAMNGGMYLKDGSPQGLFIEDHINHKEINKVNKGYGNFYLQPNGVFFLTKDKQPTICTSLDFRNSENIQYATQSGPMLVIDGALHPKFREGSSSLYIRNGVGILPNGNLLFAISKQTINFFDFATFFQQKGCKNALYLDGFVSRVYLPEKNWEQLDGNFGVIIGVIE